MRFLTARWENLCLVTWAVPPALLEPRLPAGLELDRRDGKCFVSLVAFWFANTRVWGIPWPTFRHFAELNLRFYVRHGSERGVVFIREFVPQRFVAWMARTIYNEPYHAAPLSHVVTTSDDAATITALSQLTWRGRPHTLRMTGSLPGIRVPADSDEHFFKEHRWGYNTDRRGRVVRYQVEHPEWVIYPVQSHELDFDFASVYGPEWEFLKDEPPYSTVFAAGSAISVFTKSWLPPGEPGT
ncbi:MAG: YqjF family protein [Planctomycetota bacterium]